MELNQKALDVVTSTFGTRYAGVIACYVRACNQEKEPKPIPFDAALMKPGDEVIVEGGICAPYKYLAVTRVGIVVLENCDGGVSARAANECTIPPKPKKTVKVRLFRNIGNRMCIGVISESSWGSYVDDPNWEPCSAIVEIEVTE